MKVGFIGGGKIAEAIIASILRAKLLGASEMFASDISAERRRHLKRRYGINVYSKNVAVVGAVDVLFLCVKPQGLGDVLKEINEQITNHHLVISVAAGKRLTFLETALPGTRIIRVMPNLPCMVSSGMTVFCGGKCVTAADLRKAVKLLGCFGEVLELPEDQFDAVTALSGSGPAFFAYLLDRMVDAGIREGLSDTHALLLAKQTMFGTAKLLVEEKLDPKDLIASVASPKGTTVAGLKVLDKSPIAMTIRKTIRAAAKRSKELSS